MLRRMIHLNADFCGVEILTYCVLSNHFHVLVRVPLAETVSDDELIRRYKVLYPKPTKYQTASIAEIEKGLRARGEAGAVIRNKLLARMSDVSEYMKAVKQRFSVWYNRSHERYGTLWAERFKSVLVQGQGNPLQTMAAYIDLNPVRAGLVEDPKDYRFCGYSEAVAGGKLARSGLASIWGDYDPDPIRAHRLLIFGKGSVSSEGAAIDREKALKVLEQEDGVLSKAEILRCRIRYFTDGAILGSAEFVRDCSDSWQSARQRRYPPKVNVMRGADWGDLAVIQGLRRLIFS
jgi:REP element-mobilizing transposase RayT